MKIEVINKERIRPSSPTPPHLRTYKVCYLDQLVPPVYVPTLFFYLNDDMEHIYDSTYTISEIISKKSNNLKISLKETLTHFYPLAGKIKDNGLYVDCNDAGVDYVETLISCDLSTFLKEPDFGLTHQLLAKIPNNYEDSDRGSDVAGVQVNFFECGGVGLSICPSHKILDGLSVAGFLNYWANTNQGLSKENPPSLIASSLFPPSDLLKLGSTFCTWPSMFEESKSVTKRFVFSSQSLVELKEKIASSETVRNPSRVLSVFALIWKRAMEAASKTKHDSKNIDSVLTLAVDIRRRSDPPLEKSTIGNLIWPGVAKSTPKSSNDLASLVGYLRNGISKIDNEFCQGLRGKNGHIQAIEVFKDLMNVYSKKGTYYLSCTSLCSSGMYETDFGWGKPVWVFLGLENQPLNVYLIDTRSGDGIEAWVSLLEEDMVEFENDPEILAFSSLNPSPLKIMHPNFQLS